MSGVSILTVSVEDGEQRLDRWLKRQFPMVTQGAVEKMCRTGQIRVDGGRVKASTHVVPGNVVRVPPMPTSEAPPRPPETGISISDERMIQDAVLWKDEHIIVLNGYKDKPKLVHRLDKDTSGVLMLARTDRVARALSETLRHHAARKIYWAVVAGVALVVAAGGAGTGGGEFGDSAAAAHQSVQREREAEAIAINSSLHVLTRVVAAHAGNAEMAAAHAAAAAANTGGGEGAQRRPPVLAHVPFRDSLLTTLLRDSIGGNTRTSFVVCLAEGDAEQSWKSCVFARLARAVRNAPRVNARFDDGAALAALRAQVNAFIMCMCFRGRLCFPVLLLADGVCVCDMSN